MSNFPYDLEQYEYIRFVCLSFNITVLYCSCHCLFLISFCLLCVSRVDYAALLCFVLRIASFIFRISIIQFASRHLLYGMCYVMQCCKSVRTIGFI